MEAYTPLLVRTKVPQPSLQRYAVIQIFEKLRSTPSILNPNSDPEREAITQCLQSSSLAVVDQSVHELCRLVKESKLDHSFALLELQSALEGCPPRFVNVFVKGIGFLVRFGFRSKRFISENFVHAPEDHPFVKVLASRSESQNELVQQVVLFVVHGKQNGIGEVCDYLRPLLTFSVLMSCSSDSSLSSFLSLVIYSLMSLCCSLLNEASPLLEMLIDCLRCFSLRGAEDIGKAVIFAELLVDAHSVVLQHLVKIGSMVTEAQLIGVKLLDALLTLCLEFETCNIESKPVLELSRRLLSFQKELKLHYLPQFYSPMLSLFVLLAQLELEDEKLFVLDLLAYILKWRIHDGSDERKLFSLTTLIVEMITMTRENVMPGAVCNPCEVSLFFFPIISLMSSPSNTVKQAASQFLLMLEKLLLNGMMPFVIVWDDVRSKQLKLVVDLPPCSFFLNIYSACGNRNYESGSKSWLSHLGKYALSIAEGHKSSVLMSSSHEVVSTEVPFLLGALTGSLVVHQSLGSSAIETLAALSNMEPKLGVSLLLAVLYYCNLLRSNIKDCNEWLLKLLTMLSVLASNSSMLPLILQTVLPMLQKDSNPVLYATSLRLLCKAWEINDRVFGSLRSFLLPECFVEFRFDETISISMAASLRDVCRRNPERGVQLILSVAVCIESSGSIIRALGYQSIGYLCEADAVDFYTAWNVIAKYGPEYSTDPVLAYRVDALEGTLADLKAQMATIVEKLQTPDDNLSRAVTTAVRAAMEEERQKIAEERKKTKEKVTAAVDKVEERLIRFRSTVDTQAAIDRQKITKLQEELEKTRQPQAQGMQQPIPVVEENNPRLGGGNNLTPGGSTAGPSNSGPMQGNPTFSKGGLIASYGLPSSSGPPKPWPKAPESQGLCSFLRWGAMDAEAYAEASVIILQILWDIGSSNCYNVNPLWIKARATAIKALSCFEVMHFERSIPDFRDKAMELLIHETDIHVLQAIEELETKIIAYEHRILGKSCHLPCLNVPLIEMIMGVGGVRIKKGKRQGEKRYAAGMIPGTAVFQLQFNQKDANHGKSEIADDVFAKYHNMLKQVSASLYLSRNILIALLSLQSWKSFMQNWLHKYTSVLVVKASTSPLDKISEAANIILKCMIKVAEDSMPRVAENIALAIGAFCMILPASVHHVKVLASKFLLDWLFQYEHEHCQWSAAISIGVISTCLHSTDRQQKLQCVNGLIEVVCESRNILVKGACGIGLGYSCQDLLTRDVTADNALDQASFVLQEKALLGKIVRTLSLTIWQLTKISSDLLVSLSKYKAPGLEDDDTKATSPMTVKRDEDDQWGVTGLVMGFGMSVSALSRAGSYDAMCSIKILLTSWIAEADSILTESTTGCQSLDMLLTTGACLVLPTVASVCRRLEKMHDNELSDLLLCYENLISKLQMEKTCNILHHNQLMAACVGSKPDHRYPEIAPITFSEGRESSHVNAPLLSSSCFAEDLLALIQDIFLVAQDSSDSQLQAYASWAMSFLHQHLCSIEDKDENISSLPNNQSFSKDASVMQLSTWLMQLDYSRDTPHVNTVAAVLRCLSSVPRLPKLDWGAVIRRCMKYVAHISEFLPQETSSVKSSLRKECVLFSLAHGNKIDPLLSFLDELTSLFRFRTLDLITQSCLLFHLLNLTRIFSSSRTKVLLEDISEFLSSQISSYRNYNVRQKRFLLLSCWKGLSNCFDEDSLDTSEYLFGMEKCMEILFASLPAQPTAFSELELMPTLEWNEAIVCLGKAKKAWLLDLLQISTVTLVPRDDYFGVMLKKMLAITELVKLGSLPLTELAKLKSYMLNTRSQGMWKLFVEITAVLQDVEGSIKRQWVVSVLEISCITKYPSTALQFLGLISGCFCKYMPLFVLDPQAVLADLPITLSSLLSSIKWRGVADAAVSCLWTLTVRIYSWAKTVTCNDGSLNLDIDPSEAEMSNLLMQVLLDACHNLKEFLPLKNQLMLANMVMC
uniref:DUF3730 domain-containing protein n=1 Tax=Chenopodium quinoa TaxID=63459 RepID=A0A803MT51_CHEQI